MFTQAYTDDVRVTVASRETVLRRRIITIKMRLPVGLIFYKRVLYSQRYLFNANPDANDNASPTNPTNPTTKYCSE